MCDKSCLPMVRFAMASSKPKWRSMFTSRLHAKKYPLPANQLMWTIDEVYNLH